MAPFLFSFFYHNAAAVWQWFHFLLDQVPPGRSVLRLNLDETSVRFWYEPRQGLRSNSGPTRKTGCARQASRGQLRRAFTHVAIICDDASLQPYMPQVLLVNERTVTVEQTFTVQHQQSCSHSALPSVSNTIWRAASLASLIAGAQGDRVHMAFTHAAHAARHATEQRIAAKATLALRCLKRCQHPSCLPHPVPVHCHRVLLQYRCLALDSRVKARAPIMVSKLLNGFHCQI